MPLFKSLTLSFNFTPTADGTRLSMYNYQIYNHMIGKKCMKGDVGIKFENWQT